MSTIITFTALDSECSRWGVTPPNFKSGFVVALKANIPNPADRYWEPGDGYWSIAEEWVQEAAETLLDFWPGAEIEWVEV
jgi:hypothetical protein